MANQFSIIASKRSLHALSVVLKTEGLTFHSGPEGGRSAINLVNTEEVDEDFRPSPNARLFVTLSPCEDGEHTRKFAERMLKISCPNVIPAQKGFLRFRNSPIFEATSSLLHSFGFSEVLVPLDGVVECEVRDAKVVAELEVEGKLYPAIVLREGHYLITFDLGRSLASLLTEAYFEPESKEKPLSSTASFVYRMTPYHLRLAIYRRLLKQAQNKRNRASHFATVAPIDAAGWTLYQVLVNALDHSVDLCPRIWKWPETHGYAFCFTHDLEPRKYAYYRGLPGLLETLKELNIKSTFSVVAEPPFDLPQDVLRRLPEDGHEIISHGLYHDGTFHGISGTQRASQVKKSLRKLENLTGAEIKGFRAPWLQRTADLGELLAGEKVVFDSSFVDADTSLKKAWYGRGISFNFPFYLFTDGEGTREYSVCELPLTGPQDMEPYYTGLNMEECQEQFRRKHEWLKSIGGLFVFLAHAGVYGRRDQETRLALLRYLSSLIERKDVWLAKLGEVADWWSRREGLKVIPLARRNGRAVSFEVENQGSETVSNFSLAIPFKFPVKSAYVGNKREAVTEKNGNLFVPIAELRPGGRIEVRISGEER